MRRIIAGHRGGKSVIVDDAEVPAGIDYFGLQMIPMWKTEAVPSIPLKQTDFNINLPSRETFGLGEAYACISILPPEDKQISDAKAAGVDVGEDFGMHTTDTIDMGIIVSGEVWLELDDGKEVHLKAGDCGINTGTRHAWHNRSSENCVLFAVMIGAKRES